MADVNANIGINIDTSQSLAEIKNLQRQLAQLYTSINKGSAAAAAAQKGLATNLMNTINAGGKFYAQMGTIRTSTESFTHALEKNKLTMREYFRFAGGSTRTFGKLFKSEFDTIGKVAEERVKKMQTQYIKLGRDASGAMKAISITPTTLNMKDYGTQVAIAAQKQALLNQLLKQGSTNLLNFGKNTQWAGRQLMVGFTIPLAYFGTAASKTFMDLEAQALKFRRVYGDMFTTTAETDKALSDIQNLAKEFTKYGVAVVKTMEMAASAAAMGKTGAELTAQVAQATRLAVLGNVEQEQALETTISLTNAFGIAAEDLTGKINFLNAVENQTVTAIEDLTIAIPKAGPVIQQLGGSVEDLAFFLTAMREGGINASEGANALKSGLASLINPTKKAAAMLNDMGINIKAIVEGNAGNLREIVIDFAQALDTLAPLERARAIEQLFGKFQFARLSTLFQNVTKDGTQASRVLDLAGKSVEELAILSERELKAVEDAVGTNFKAAVEELKLAIAPIGKEFLKAITPVVKFLGDLFEKFNNLSDGSKKFIVVLSALIGLVGPTLLMTFGLLANGAANIIKLFLLMRQGFLKLTGNSTNLAQQTQYLNQEQLEAATVAASLNQAHTKLTQQFTLEAGAVNALRNAYIQATAAATRFAAANPGMMMPGFKPGIKGGGTSKFASGTTEVVGGQAGKDSVPSLLTPGEAVIPTKIAQDDRFKPLIAALVSGEIAKYKKGTVAAGDDYAHVGSGKLTDLDKIIQTGGLTQNERRQAEIYRDILTASGQKPEARAYGSLAYSFDAAMNKQMATKLGVPIERFEKAWLSRPDKWIASGLTSSEARVIDRAILEKIKDSGVKNVTDAVVEKAFRELPPAVKSTQAYQKMSMLQDKIGSYSLGKGLGSTPKTSAQILEQAKKSGMISDYRVETRVGKNGQVKTKSIIVVTNDGKEVNLGRGSRANRIYFADGSLSKSQKAAVASVAAAKGEVYQTKDGKTKTVTGQTGTSKPAGKNVTASPRDTRVMSTQNLARIFPYGVKGPRFAGAIDGYNTPAMGVKSGGAPRASQDQERAIKANTEALDETTKQTKTIGQKFSTGANVFSGLTIMGSFMGGKIGELSQKLAPLAIGLSTISMLLPGLKSGFLKLGAFLAANPFVAVGIALASLVVAYKVLDEKTKQQAAAQSRYIDTISATTEKMKRVGEITGQVGASEIMSRRRQGAGTNTFSDDLNRAGQQFGTTFLESEVGKEILTTFQNNLVKGGSQAVKQISLELSSYISDGIMTAEQANSVARSIGISLSDMSLYTDIQGQLNSIVGPNGERLESEPLQVRLQIIRESGGTQEDYLKTLQEEFSSQETNSKLRQEVAASIGAMASQTLETIRSQRDAQAKMYDDQIRALQAEKQSTQDKEKQLQIQEKIETLQKQALEDDKNLGAQRQNSLNLTLKAYQEIAAQNKLNFLPSKEEKALFASAQEQVKIKFAEDPFTGTVLKSLSDLSGAGSEQLELTLLTTLGAGDMTPMQVSNLLKLYDSNVDEITKVLNTKIALENPDKFAQLQNLAGNLKGKNAKQVGIDLIASLTAEGGEEKFDSRLATLDLLSKLDGKEIDLAAYIETKGVEGLDLLAEDLDALEKMPDVTQKTVETTLKEIGMSGAGIQGVTDNWEYFSKLPDTVRKQAIQVYTALYETLFKDEASRLAFYAKYKTGGDRTAAGHLAQLEGGKRDVEYTLDATRTIIGEGKEKNTIPGGAGDGGGGGGAGRDTTLDNLLNRLKFIRKASIDAQGGLEELMKITGGAGLSKFGGVMQQLMEGTSGGFNREFISFLEGMDDKTRKTYMTVKNGQVILTKNGKALKEAFNEKVIGEYQVAQVQALQDTRAQGAALLKLRAAGVDSATALEMVADANLAVAINSKNITSEELVKMAKKAKEAKDEVKKLNLEVLNLAEDLKKKVADAGNVVMALAKARAAGITDPEILRQISQNQSLIDEILNKGTDTETTKGIISAWQALDKLGEVTEGLIDPAKEAMDAFNKLKDAAMQVFDRQAREAQMDFDKSLKDLASTVVKDLPEAFKGLSIEDAITKANEEIDSLQQQIKDIEYTKIRPIDLQIEQAESQIDDFRKKLETSASKLKLKDGKLLPDAAYDDVKQKLQDKISEAELDLEFNPQYGARLVEKLQDEISKKELEIELNFTRPIAALQEESSDLSNDLTLMDKIADGINKKYDAQAEALQRVSEINQQILDQQKSQLDIAGALSQGDIAAAARAAQEARAQAASAASQRAGGVLDAARQAEISGLRSASGMTRIQIEERQFQITQQIYQLEEQSELKQKAILAIQDQIRGIEEIRTQKQREIRDIQDQIAAGERAREQFIRENILPLENQIKDLQAKRQGFVNDIKAKEADILRIQNEILAPLEAEVKKREKILSDRLKAIDAEKLAWEQAQIALEKATGQAAKFADQAKNAQDAFKAAKDIYDKFTDKKVTITVETIVNQVQGSTLPTVTGTRVVDGRTVVTGTSTTNAKNPTVTGTRIVDGRTVVTGMQYEMYGGKIKPMAFGGRVGSDSVPAMLTPGEFVVNKGATKAFLPFLTAINESKYPSILGRKMKDFAGAANMLNSNVYSISQPNFVNTSLSEPSYSVSNPTVINTPVNSFMPSVSDNSSTVYNYNVGITVGGNTSSPDRIAKAVLNEIKYIDSQRIRNQRA